MAKNRSAAEAFNIAGSKSARSTTERSKSGSASSPAPRKTLAPNAQTVSTAKKQAAGAETQRLTANVPVELLTKLRERAFKENRSLTNIVLDALEQYLKD